MKVSLPYVAIAALVLGAHGAALAQDPPPPVAPTAPLTADERLNRIEGKLDEILRRLNAAPASSLRPSGAVALAAPAAPGRAVPAIDSGAYKPGALAILHPAPEYPRDLQQIPADSVGGFVYRVARCRSMICEARAFVSPASPASNCRAG